MMDKCARIAAFEECGRGNGFGSGSEVMRELSQDAVLCIFAVFGGEHGDVMERVRKRISSRMSAASMLISSRLWFC